MVRTARQAIGARRFEEAAAVIRQVRHAHPLHPGGLIAESMLALSTGQLASARKAAEGAMRLAPEDPDARLQLAFASHALADVPAARKALDGFENIAATDRQYGRAGAILVMLACHPQALACFEKAAKLAPDQALHWFNLGAVLRFLGRMGEAEAAYDKAIHLSPDDAEAWLNRSHLRRQSPEANHVAQLQTALARVDGWAGQVQLRYALAKELEDLGDAKASFQELAAGARIRRANLSYDVGDDAATLASIAQTFDRDWLDGGGGCRSDAPIFVIGMPRSGTTLVERIIGSHQQIEACGELDAFPNALMARAKVEAPAARDKQALVKASAGFDMTALGQSYLDLAAPFRSGLPLFVDKLPLNFLYLGLIARALPEARFVHVSRHPMANCYGMLKTLFKQGYPFSYDIADLATYYSAYRRLMAHWSTLLGNRLVGISYERLVDDQEGETRRLLSSLGLAWDPQCLSFHANPAPSTTQSAVQVRRPLYREALDQWRSVEKELAPLRAALIMSGIDETELA